MKAKSLKETRDDIRKQLQNINLETLKLLAEDHNKAKEFITIGREVAGGERLSSKQIKEMASEMQALAKMLLDEKINNS